jgi:hypothetical protein
MNSAGEASGGRAAVNGLPYRFSQGFAAFGSTQASGSSAVGKRKV